MKTVHDLNQDELEELRNSYFYDEDINRYQNVDDIPNEVLFEHYEDISFVEEDFFCNILE